MYLHELYIMDYSRSIIRCIWWSTVFLVHSESVEFAGKKIMIGIKICIDLKFPVTCKMC